MCEAYMCSLFPSTSHQTEFRKCICVCVPECSCVSPLYISCSDTTKFCVVPSTCECLSHQNLTLMPGKPFINMSPLPYFCFDTIHWDTPMCRYSPGSTQPLPAHSKLSHIYAWMPSYLCLTSVFLHKLPPSCGFPLLQMQAFKLHASSTSYVMP